MEAYRVLCFGDSNTWGYIPVSGRRYSRDVRWTGVLARRLGAAYEVIEEGQNGRTTVWDDPLEGDKSGLRYLPACLESHAPLHLVILMLGTNDLKARFSLTALDIAAGAERLVKLILSTGGGAGGYPPPAVLLAAPPSVLPQGDLAEMFLGAPEKSARLAQRYAEAAQRCGCAFMDVSRVLSVDPADGIHYSPQGHAALGAALVEQVQAILPPSQGAL